MIGGEWTRAGLIFQFSKDGPFSFLWSIYVFIKEQSPPLMGPQLYVPYQSPLPRIWRIWRRSWRLRQRGWWIQVLQVQQVFIGNRSRRWRGPSLSQTWLSSKSDLSILTRFGHFARECREEEDRCYKCHGNFLNWAHDSTGWLYNHSPFPWISCVGF